MLRRFDFRRPWSPSVGNGSELKRIFQANDFEVFECLPHPVWVFDSANKSMWWANSPAVDLWNAKSLQDLLARDFSDMSEATKERLANYNLQFAAGETVTEQWTFYPKGEPSVVVCTCSGVMIEDGRLALLIEGRPISKTDVDPNTLRCVEALQHTSLMVSIFSLDGSLIFQNPAASKTFSSDLRLFAERFHNPTTATQLWQEVSAGRFVSLEAECNTRTGIRWHGIDCKLTRDPVEGKQVVLCNQRDLHVLKVTELKLEQAIGDAEAMAQTKSRFLANMSHEIRTPLNGVLGMAQLLAESTLNANQKQYVEHMQDAAHILRTLIDDILDYSTMEAGRLRLDPKPFSLKKCFMTCITLVRPRALEKGLAFYADEEIADDLYLLGDEVRLTQVLLNLLINAIKFTQRGEVKFGITPMSQSKEMCALQFTVVDTGIGISAEDQKKLFARFTQLDNSRRRGQAGTGLGLAICRELIDLMYGHIELSSELGKGTTFTIDLKLPIVQPESKTPLLTPRITDEGSAMDVLLVEDNLTNQMVAKRMVTKLGHQCRIANNGREALEQLASKRPDLILMDVVMPIMDGMTATRKIRELQASGPRTPVIALTANVMKEDKDQYLESGMDDFLAKPLDLKILRELLTKWQSES